MRAIVIREFGPPDVLRLEEVPTPEPGPGEVLIKVHAVSVNRTLDTVVRAGKYVRRVTLPLVPGVDPSGVVAKLGPGVTCRKVGDRVVTQLRVREPTDTEPPRLLGVHTWGGYAEYELGTSFDAQLKTQISGFFPSGAIRSLPSSSG